VGLTFSLWVGPVSEKTTKDALLSFSFLFFVPLFAIELFQITKIGIRGKKWQGRI
jgi:hypothetical protein